MADFDWLVVGLGNPGPEYEWSPHNMGFLAVDRLAAAHSIRINRKESMALTGIGRIGSTGVVLAKPQTYMNLSGQAVKSLLARYELAPDRLLVAYDDLDLPWQNLRIRPHGSPAGHNGMKSIVASLGTQQFARLRIGVHPGRPLTGGKDYLLAIMSREQRKELDEVLERCVRAIESILAEGVEKSMAMFNRRAQGSIEEEE